MSHADLFSDTHIYYAFLEFSLRVLADERDKKKFLDFVLRLQKARDFRIYAFCVLDSEVHFLMELQKEQKDEIRRIVKELENWYRQYSADMHLSAESCSVQTHISSVEGDEELIAVCRMIHQIPVQRRYVKHRKDYWWSSFQAYRGAYQWAQVEPKTLFQRLNIEEDGGRRLLLKYSEDIS